MKYIITGSLGNISKPLAQKLIAAGHEVTVISSKEDKKEEIESLGASAAIGSVEDIAFLEKTFRGADAVYTMIPPVFTSKDWKKHIASIGANYAETIRKSGVRNVVNLSSIGAHMPDGCGPVSGLFFAEKALNELAGTNVKHLRPGYFYSNFYGQADMIKHMGIMGGNYGEETKITLAHTKDIAEVAAEELLKLDFKGKSHRYVISDEKTPNEIATVIGSAIQKPDLKWVNFTDEQSLGGLVQAGLSEEVARNYTEMGRAMRSGEMIAEYVHEKPGVVGKTKLQDFAKEFSTAFQQ